jgi:hypothetical protein
MLEWDIYRSCRENQNTHFFGLITPARKSCRLWDDVEKGGGAGYVSGGYVKANSHIPCRAHAVPLPCHAIPYHTMPCHAAKGLDCIFPIWFTQCGRVCFTHTTSRQCHATTMPFWKWPLKASAQPDMAWHVWISIGRPETACWRPARVRLLPATTRNSTDVVIGNIRIR